METLHITPEPDDEEAAAIAAAVTVATAVSPAAPEEPALPRWRFSGRWWSAPVSVRRARP